MDLPDAQSRRFASHDPSNSLAHLPELPAAVRLDTAIGLPRPADLMTIGTYETLEKV